MGRYLTALLIFGLLLLFPPQVFAFRGDAVEGRKLFMTYCFICHGAGGKGDGPLAKKLKVPPADLTDNSLAKRRSDVELFAIIEGRQFHQMVTDEMPKWGNFLPEKKIWQLVSYVRVLHRFRHPITGDPGAGEPLYKQYCSACHGPKGRGDGVLSSLLSAQPADHSNPVKMDRVTNEELTDVITNGGKGEGSLMPGWKGVLSQSEIDSLVSYIRLLSH